ncbi:MAG: HAMP domain-containing histidine kinase [Gammaproteobacteria bacterium]|nr:HAMP domain-containing histidine kinase [Gammaproteobacteria bacterium]
MPFIRKNYTLKKYISHTLLGTISFIFLIAFIAGVFIEKNNAKIERIAKIHDTHTTLSSIIAPELSIYNVMEIRRLLALSSSKDIFFSVIDNNKNIYMSDYLYFDVIKKLISANKNIDCSLLNKTEKTLHKNHFFYCSPIYYYDQNTENGTRLGVLISFNNLDFTFKPWILLMKLLFSLFVISGLLFILLKINLHKKLLSPLIKLEKKIAQLDYTNICETTNMGDIGWAPIEIHKIKSVFDQLLNRLYLENIRIRESEKKATLSHFAIQIAHDIRSPLAALEVLAVDANQFPEKKRLLIKHAINRINDIANNLLSQYRLIKKLDNEEIENYLTSELISDLIYMVVSEKRLQLNKSNVKISFEIHEQAHGICVNINPGFFKRTLSNILNNAIEATSGKGNIRVSLKISSKEAIIKIVDTGCGIPDHLLPLLLNGSSSHGKEGHGLGLSSAIAHVKSWNGTLTIESQVNHGTTIKICLPLAKPPAWFAGRILFSKNIKYVVVVDDEESVHQIWDNRLEFLSKTLDFKIIHFNDPTEFISWCKININEPYLLLVDYQFEGCKINGMELIKQCGAESHAILVTSCYELDILREECLRSGVKLLPKFFFAYIPIEITDDIKIDLIFLDNDSLITNTWELSCELKNINIKTFNDVDLFLQEIIDYSIETPLYIDSELNDGIKGEEIARDLYMMGYRNLYLVTGKPHDNFPNLYWINAISGKNCPY